MHSKNLVHRDIKSDNVMLTNDGYFKLGHYSAVPLSVTHMSGDFGFSAQLTDERAKRNSVIGTPYWMPPVHSPCASCAEFMQEVINGDDYDVKVDVWSTGTRLTWREA